MSDKQDALDHMNFLATASRIAFIHPIADDESWIDVRWDIEAWCEDNLEGPFSAVLGNEDKLSDTEAEYAIYYIGEENLEKIRQQYIDI